MIREQIQAEALAHGHLMDDVSADVEFAAEGTDDLREALVSDLGGVLGGSLGPGSPLVTGAIADWLLTHSLAPLLAKVRAVEDLIAEEEAYRAGDPAWEITVVVPAKAGDDVCERIFDAVADTAYEVEPERKDWDVFVSSVKNPVAVPVHMLRRALDDDRG